MSFSKTAVDDLAVFGGPPAFAEPLHVGRPNIGDPERFLDRVRRIFANRWLTNNGPFVQEFEARIAEFCGVKHCIAMTNATVALEIAVCAAGMEAEVIVPAFTFVATVHALQWQGIKPVFCDVDPRTHALDPRRVAELITERTGGILGVHVWGRPAPVDELADLAARHDLPLVFDAAHAFGCSHRGRMIGSFGHAEVFSFHATKFVNCFEGGCVVTNDAALDRKIRFMKNFGFAGLDQVVHVGTNGKMSEVAAAMGLTSLEDMPAFVAVNRQHYDGYRAQFSGMRGVTLQHFDAAERNNYQYVVLDIDAGATGIGRDDLLTVLRAENVLARRYFYPGCHRMEPYRSMPQATAHLPQTERLVQRVLQLPTGTAVGPADIERIGALLRFAVANGPQIARRLAAPSSARAA